MENRTEALLDQVSLLQVDAIDAQGVGSELLEVLIEARTLLEDALTLTRYPSLRRMHVISGGLNDWQLHAVKPSSRNETLCGYFMDKQIVFDRHVPNCPRCIAILTQKDGLGDKT